MFQSCSFMVAKETYVTFQICILQSQNIFLLPSKGEFYCPNNNRLWAQARYSCRESVTSKGTEETQDYRSTWVPFA